MLGDHRANVLGGGGDRVRRIAGLRASMAAKIDEEHAPLAALGGELARDAAPVGPGTVDAMGEQERLRSVADPLGGQLRGHDASVPWCARTAWRTHA